MLVSDLIAYSLRVAGVLGVGQQPLQQDLQDAENALIMLLAQWQRRRWVVYRLTSLDCPVISGQPSYSIGNAPGADITYDRPGSIETAFIRQLIGSAGPSSLPVDFPLQRIDSWEEWNRIALKNLKSWPGSFFYDPTQPNGTLYIWPIPNQTFFELYISVPQSVTDFAFSDDVLDFLPPETEEALVYNLAMRFRIMYQLPPSQELFQMARVTLQTMRSTNLRLQKLRMPAAVMGRGGRWKNPNAGFYPELATGVPYSVLP